MTRGNEKFIRRSKEVARQQAQKEKREKRAQRKAAGGGGAAGDEDVAAIEALIQSGVDPATLMAGKPDKVEGEDEEAAEGAAEAGAGAKEQGKSGGT